MLLDLQLPQLTPLTFIWPACILLLALVVALADESADSWALDAYTCFSDIVQWQKCCLGNFSVFGNPSCWDASAGITFSNCCGYDPEPVKDLLEEFAVLRRGLYYEGYIDGDAALYLLNAFLALPLQDDRLEPVLTVYAGTCYAAANATGMFDDQFLEENTEVQKALLRRYSGFFEVDLAMETRQQVLIVGGVLRDKVVKDTAEFMNHRLQHSLNCAARDPNSETSGFLYNPWEPNQCFKHHHIMDKWIMANRDPPVFDEARIITDWLGVRVPRAWCNDKFLQGQWSEITRALECVWSGPPILTLVAGEDYFESIALLRAVLSAPGPFVVVELGSGWGFWAVKAAVAWHTQSLSSVDPGCDVVLVDSNASSLGLAPAHIAENKVSTFCNVSTLLANATARLLDELLVRFGTVDFLDVDIQGQEFALFRDSKELHRVRHLSVGTHSRRIHRGLQKLLQAAGFKLEFDYPGNSFPQTRFGRLPVNDGVLIGSRPHEMDML